MVEGLQLKLLSSVLPPSLVRTAVSHVHAVLLLVSSCPSVRFSIRNISLQRYHLVFCIKVKILDRKSVV